MIQAQPFIVHPDAPLPFIEDQTGIKKIHTHNIQDNIDIMQRTAPARSNIHDTISMVIEDQQPVDRDRHFTHLRPLTSIFNKDLQLKTRRDVPHQKVIYKLGEQLNCKTMHFFNLPFALDTLRKS